MSGHEITRTLSGVERLGDRFEVGLLTDDEALVQRVGIMVRRCGGRLLVASDPAAAFDMLASTSHAARIVDMASLARLLPNVTQLASIVGLDGLTLLVGAPAMQFAGGQPFLTRSYARGAVEDLLSHLATALPVNREGSFDATILGDTLRIRAVREQVRNVARFRDVSVLILGETGTGKELVAESIHRLTFGASRPFMAINCAAVPESLFESEIFGHEAGAYTGARGVRVGLLESAAGGTVFLDEIGEMPLSLQPKLLRVLESRTFRRVGSNKDIPLGARVISATNRLVFRREEGALRPDLYYRLAGFTITLPPLRERVDDVATLAHAFVRAFAERHHLHNLVLTDEAVAVLCAHRWPGNVRELRAVVEQAAILAGGGPIGEGPLATILRDPAAGARHPSTAPPPPRKDPPAPAESAVLRAARDVSESPESLRDVERRLILQAHESSAGNLTRAAKALGMPRTTLRAKLRRWGILALCSQGTRARVAMDTPRATRVRSGRRASSSAGPALRLARASPSRGRPTTLGAPRERAARAGGVAVARDPSTPMEDERMTTVLVVDDDDLLRASLARDLVQQGFDVQVADSVDTAETALRARSFDVLLADLRMNGRDGIDLLGTAREISGRTRAVLMSAYASARDHETAHDLGAVRVLCKPFTPRQLIEAIRQAAECDVGFRGSFHGLSLIDMLQMFHFGRRSISVTVAGKPSAVVQVRDGEIVHAAKGDLVGEEALFSILAASSGSIRTSVLGAAPQTISRPFQELVLDAMRAMDEEAREDEREDEREEPGASAEPEPGTPPGDGPPGAAEASHEARFAALRGAAKRVGTDGVLGAVSTTSPAVVPLQGDFPWDELGANVRSLSQDVTRLVASWSRIEIVAQDVAFTVAVAPEGDWLIVYCDALWGRYAAMRFRADVQRIVGLGQD